MADVYKQSFKQSDTNNIELSIFNCGLERCAPGQTWGPGIRDHSRRSSTESVPDCHRS